MPYFILFTILLNSLFFNDSHNKPVMMDEAILGTVKISTSVKEGMGLIILNTTTNEMHLISSLSMLLDQKASYLDPQKKWIEERVIISPYFKEYTKNFISSSVKHAASNATFEIALNIDVLSKEGRIIFEHGTDICAVVMSGKIPNSSNANERPGLGFYKNASFIGSYHYDNILPDVSNEAEIKPEAVYFPHNDQLINISRSTLRSIVFHEKEDQENIAILNDASNASEAFCRPLFSLVEPSEKRPFTLLQFKGIENHQMEVFDKKIIEKLIY